MFAETCHFQQEICHCLMTIFYLETFQKYFYLVALETASSNTDGHINEVLTLPQLIECSGQIWLKLGPFQTIIIFGVNHLQNSFKLTTILHLPLQNRNIYFYSIWKAFYMAAHTFKAGEISVFNNLFLQEFLYFFRLILHGNWIFHKILCRGTWRQKEECAQSFKVYDKIYFILLILFILYLFYTGYILLFYLPRAE